MLGVPNPVLLVLLMVMVARVIRKVGDRIAGIPLLRLQLHLHLHLHLHLQWQGHGSRVHLSRSSGRTRSLWVVVVWIRLLHVVRLHVRCLDVGGCVGQVVGPRVCAAVWLAATPSGVVVKREQPWWSGMLMMDHGLLLLLRRRRRRSRRRHSVPLLPLFSHRFIPVIGILLFMICLFLLGQFLPMCLFVRRQLLPLHA